MLGIEDKIDKCSEIIAPLTLCDKGKGAVAVVGRLHAVASLPQLFRRHLTRPSPSSVRPSSKISERHDAGSAEEGRGGGGKAEQGVEGSRNL